MNSATDKPDDLIATLTGKPYSLLANCMVTRDLWRALAHCIVLAKPGTDKMMKLNRMLLELSPGDKLRCQAEIRKCQAARRGEIEAIIAE